MISKNNLNTSYTAGGIFFLPKGAGTCWADGKPANTGFYTEQTLPKPGGTLVLDGDIFAVSFSRLVPGVPSCWGDYKEGASYSGTTIPESSSISCYHKYWRPNGHRRG